MNKLKLRLDDLAIETFPTAVVEAEETGTVIAHATKNQYTCNPAVGTCFGYTCIDACF